MHQPFASPLAPLSRRFGGDRGRPVDRHYIEGFLARHAADVQGRVLEFGDAHYTRALGGDRVARADVLNVQPGGPETTLVADIADAPAIPDATFDCIVCTQVLQYVFELRDAVATLHRILREGGVLLATVPGISQLSRYDADRWGEFWRLTSQSAARLFGAAFGDANVRVEAFGNVRVATAFLYGFTVDEVGREALDARDADYELIVAVRAVKGAR